MFVFDQNLRTAIRKCSKKVTFHRFQKFQNKSPWPIGLKIS